MKKKKYHKLDSNGRKFNNVLNILELGKKYARLSSFASDICFNAVFMERTSAIRKVKITSTGTNTTSWNTFQITKTAIADALWKGRLLESRAAAAMQFKLAIMQSSSER